MATDQRQGEDTVQADFPHLRSLCADLAKIFNGPIQGNVGAKIDAIEKLLDSTLTRLDEYQAFVSSMQANRKEAEEKIVPQLLARVENIEKIFMQIDKIEAFVNLLEESATKMEDRVRQVDNAFGDNKLKKFIGSLLRNEAAEENKSFEWKHDDIIVRHKQYFA
mmetsp:Transcript_3065/g.5678  ORF Transcript_3065/g.5678 Transcript_3065/m.5678 type:complete len:164 (-) Transcript_3065:210-701(-)